jgi:hypothetical protein
MEPKRLSIVLVILSLAVILGSAVTASLQTVIPQETGASKPLEVFGPPYDGQYSETSAQIPPNSVMDWWGDVDGGFITWEGKYQLCFTIKIYGAGPNGEDLIVDSPCPCPEIVFTATPTRTPTNTLTPTNTPTITPSPTPIQ